MWLNITSHCRNLDTLARLNLLQNVFSFHIKDSEIFICHEIIFRNHLQKNFFNHETIFITRERTFFLFYDQKSLIISPQINGRHHGRYLMHNNKGLVEYLMNKGTIINEKVLS